ncbi:MAG TPA: AraC family transcriptional regulator [Ideonella sp.]|nr:AraC family transcriptional regulator [Ideonella sp.]
MTSTPATLRQWSTDHLPLAQRLDYWVGAICEGFLEMTAESRSPEAFGAALDSTACGPMVVSRVRATPADVWRTPQAIARSSDHVYYLVGTLDAAWTSAQRDTTVRLRPGDFVLVDSEQRYEFCFPESCETVYFQLPASWLASWLPDPQAAVARAIDGHSAWGAVLGAFARQSVSLHSSIVAAIERHHASMGLTAASVATELGISERTLHRHLGLGGTTFLQAVVALRMSSALRMLRDKRFDHLGISEVGHRCGFSDPSRFARQCRAHLGKTPFRLRKGA